MKLSLVCRAGLLMLLLALLSSCSRLARGDEASACLSLEPDRVALVGTVAEAEAFGPPGYGETPDQDRRESYLLLKLDQAICVLAGPDQSMATERGVRKTQLVVKDFAAFKTRWLGHHVQIEGTLFRAQTGHHRTPVLLDAQATQEAAPPADQTLQ